MVGGGALRCCILVGGGGSNLKGADWYGLSGICTLRVLDLSLVCDVAT